MSNTNRIVVTEDESSDNEELFQSCDDDVGEGDQDGSDASWNWASRCRLVHLVDQHGKNWGLLLKKMHDEHLISSVAESDKLRIQFNSLNASKSAFRQLFKKKNFKAPSKDPKTDKKLTSAQKQLLQREHDAAEELRKTEHKNIQDLLDKIANDELKAMKGRGKKRTLGEVNNDIDEAEQERQKVKSQRTEKARQFAQRQETKERLFMNLLEKSIGVLESTNYLIKKLSGDIYPTQPFVGSDLRSPMPKNSYLEDDDKDNERSSYESLEY